MRITATDILPAQVDRFWSRVARTDADRCWLWTGTLLWHGYGQITLAARGGRRTFVAHRLAMELTIGRELSAIECACHRCDNPPCCNPAHLFIGTRTENAADRDSKSRQSKGEGRYNSVLTDAKIVDARKRFCVESITSEALANEMGVSRRTMDRVLNGSHWKHLAMEFIPECRRRLIANHAHAGSAHGRAKVTESDVIEIRRLWDAKELTIDELMGRYGLGRSPMRRIVNREGWKHVP